MSPNGATRSGIGNQQRGEIEMGAEDAAGLPDAEKGIIIGKSRQACDDPVVATPNRAPPGRCRT